jgi:hypothetical protein
MLNQDALVVAFHEHPGSVSTLTVPLPAAAGTDVLTGAIEYVQGRPVCVTVNVCPAIVIVPVLSVVFGFAVTL